MRDFRQAQGMKFITLVQYPSRQEVVGTTGESGTSIRFLYIGTEVMSFRGPARIRVSIWKLLCGEGNIMS